MNHLTSLILSFIIASPDPVRIAVEADSAKWFRGVWISGIVVAIGCGLEIWEVAIDLRNWRRHRKKLPLIPDNPGSWLYPMAALGIALVIGGIVGETIFEVLASNADAAIRSHESDVVSTAETNAATANGIAGDAEKKAAQLEKDAAQLQKDADAERLERVKLEAQVNPRRLTPAQEENIGNSLKPYAGKTVMVATYSQDIEAMILAIQIEEALGKAKIKVFDLLGTYSAMGRPLYTGVVIDTNSSNPNLVSSLVNSLTTKGRLAALPAPVMFGPGSTMYTPSASAMGVAPGTIIKDDAFIFVGEKPIATPINPIKKSAKAQQR